MIMSYKCMSIACLQPMKLWVLCLFKLLDHIFIIPLDTSWGWMPDYLEMLGSFLSP